MKFILAGTAETVHRGPVMESNAIAAISGGFSARYKKLAFNVSWADLDSAPPGAAFYFNDGISADSTIVTFPVTGGNRNGLSAGELFVTETQEEGLLNGKWYYSVNTADHPNGALKGRVSVVKTQ